MGGACSGRWDQSIRTQKYCGGRGSSAADYSVDISSAESLLSDETGVELAISEDSSNCDGGDEIDGELEVGRSSESPSETWDVTAVVDSVLDGSTDPPSLKALRQAIQSPRLILDRMCLHGRLQPELNHVRPATHKPRCEGSRRRVGRSGSRTKAPDEDSVGHTPVCPSNL